MPCHEITFLSALAARVFAFVIPVVSVVVFAFGFAAIALSIRF